VLSAIAGLSDRQRASVVLHYYADRPVKEVAEWYGGATISSCDELVESVPTRVDGGFFTVDIPGGYEVLPGVTTSGP